MPLLLASASSCSITGVAAGRSMPPAGSTRVGKALQVPQSSRPGGLPVRMLRPQRAFVRTRATATRRSVSMSAPAGMPSGQMLVYVPPHPLLNHWLAIARNKDSPSAMFHNAIAEIGKWLMYEAVRDWLPTVQFEVESPCGVANATVIDPSQPIKIIPILRAGLVLLEHVNTVIPTSQTYHLGFVRDEESLEASMYLNKLPEKFEEDDKILITDPMLATGGTIIQAIEECIKRGAKNSNIRIIAVVCAPPALKKLSEKYTGLRVYAAMIDEDLNDQGYIVPGLGDAGDRSYNT
mmetsp:Transcript_6702/g.24824  ORF Transcript_6702/g.24824 Transcript_6702/m.24824 type:complete len:293 (-) Transcript_6702:1386-2264(-)